MLLHGRPGSDGTKAGKALRLFGLEQVTGELFDAKFAFDLDDRYQLRMAKLEYEPETLALYREILGEGDIYVDIGAQLGYLIVYASHLVGKTGAVYGFEPDPRCFTRLESTISSFRKTHPERKVHIDSTALSFCASEITLQLSPVRGHSSSTEYAEEQNWTPITVKTERIDKILESLDGRRIKLLKIDVEGHEPEALLGAKKLLELGQIDYVMVENNKGLMETRGFNFDFLVQFFGEYGYCGATIPFNETQSIVEKTKSFAFEKDYQDEPVTNFLFWRGESNTAVTPKSFLGKPLSDYTADDFEVLHIISKAFNKGLEHGISAAEEYLRRKNHRHLKGHLAYWYYNVARKQDAIRLYTELLEENPEDRAVLDMLALLKET